MPTTGRTKHDRPSGRKPISDKAPGIGNGVECWWCHTGRPYWYSGEWFDEDCGLCQLKAKEHPEIRTCKTPEEISREHYDRNSEENQRKLAEIRAGAPARVAAYLAKTAAQPAPGRA